MLTLWTSRPGVLACARAINGAPNICYLEPRELAERTEPADVAYSIAVAQHLRMPVLTGPRAGEPKISAPSIVR